MGSRRRLLTAITMGAAIISGCTNGTVSPVASASTAPLSPIASPSSKAIVVIEVADSQEQGRPSNLPLAEFKTQVESLSGGTMTVVVHVDASADDALPGSDGPIVDKVKSGAFQMAVVPASQWSTVGVTTLQALQAPFLVESDEHVAAIVNDGAISQKMLSGLSTVGVTGLTLFPWSLRHFFSFTTPILSPADVKGRTIRTPGSVDIGALLAALGGKGVLPNDDAFVSGVADGTITAADSGFTVAMTSLPRAATATGNLVPYAKVITLVANTAFWNGLDDAQRNVVSGASAATRAWAIANLTSDVLAAAKYCADGGKVVLTDTASIQAFRAAEAPLYDRLEADPGTKELISAIRQRGTGAPSAPVKACG
jgi:TRAP-type C4-dicarboxylate transport system substrate-binding protein